MDGSTPAEVLDRRDLKEQDSAAYDLAMGQLGSGAIPELDEVGTGDLHREFIAVQYVDVVQALRFAEEAARKARASNILLISTSRWRASYLVAELRNRGFSTRALSLPDERRDGNTLSGTSPEILQYSEYTPLEGAGGGALDVLFLAESAAMLGTMVPVVTRLRTTTSLRTGLYVTDRVPAPDSTSPPDDPAPGNNRVGAVAAGNSSSSATVQALAAIARQLSSRFIRESELAAPAAEEFLDEHEPRLLVLGNDRVWSGQLVARAARARGIPVLCVQDGLAVDGPIWWSRTADFTATNGEYLRDVLLRRGASPESVFVTGQPRMDPMHEQAEKLAADAAREALGFAPGVRHVLLALQGMHDTRYLRQAVSAFRHMEDVHVIVRPHHWQSSRVLAASVRAGEAGDGKVTFRSDDDIGTLLRAVDAVVSQYSTILVEAALMGTPAVALSFSGRHDPLDLAGAGIALGARSRDELKAAVERALAADGSYLESAREAARHMLGPFDGHSAERVARLVERLAHSEGPMRTATAYPRSASAAGSTRTRGQEGHA